ncbi:MAG TPA: PKD domain-containing protein [Vicinamibacterales bacterium]|jgi:PKD repeat protein
MRPRFLLTTVLSVLALATAACTSSKIAAPSLTGPSSFGLGMSVDANPDVLTQNGSAQSQITIQTRDENGRPEGQVPVYVEIEVNGVPSDFGTLSAHNLATDTSGAATVTYTAPPKPAFSVDTQTDVTIIVTPVGTDFASATPRTVTIRLQPPGVIIPPVDFTPAFSFTPSGPTVLQSVLFDASTSTDPSDAITSYSWDFGDGSTGSGETASHAFGSANTYSVRLTVSDAHGRTASATQQVTVTASAPTASFVVSPNSPKVNTQANFNAAASVAGAGRTIKTYAWDFGDGTTASGSSSTTSHTYTTAASYTVTLTVTDDAGQTSTTTVTVVVGS